MLTFKDTGLREFPFKDVPPTGPTDLWVGRSEFRAQLNQLVSSWTYNPNSTIYFIWADFGAGKTHALRYIEHLSNIKQESVVAVYCELPKAVSQFKLIFEQITPQFPEQILCDSIRFHRQKYGENWLSAPILNGDRDTPRVLWTLAQTIGQPLSEIPRKWLKGERLYPSETRTIDYISPIKTSDHATKVLSTLCKLILQSGQYIRVAIMLDEFQRIGQSNKKQIKEINDGIHSLFNNCPQGLSIILTYSIGVPDSIKYLVTEAVISRVHKIYNLSVMSKTEMMQFIIDLLAHYKKPDSTIEVFTKKGIETAINKLYKATEGKMTPRAAMQGFSKMLEKTLNGQGPDKFPIDESWVERLWEDPVSEQLLL